MIIDELKRLKNDGTLKILLKGGLISSRANQIIEVAELFQELRTDYSACESVFLVSQKMKVSESLVWKRLRESKY